MTQLSKLWAMAYDNYIDTKWENIKETKYIKDMEDTLFYWWTRASCDELKTCYNHLQQRIKARERLPK